MFHRLTLREAIEIDSFLIWFASDSKVSIVVCESVSIVYELESANRKFIGLLGRRSDVEIQRGELGKVTGFQIRARDPEKVLARSVEIELSQEETAAVCWAIYLIFNAINSLEKAVFDPKGNLTSVEKKWRDKLIDSGARFVYDRWEFKNKRVLSV